MNYNNIVIVGIAAFKPIYEYAIEKKSEVSLSTRGDQVNVLSTSFVGKGFGNTADYRGNISTQSVWIWFVFLNIYLFFLKIFF